MFCCAVYFECCMYSERCLPVDLMLNISGWFGWCVFFCLGNRYKSKIFSRKLVAVSAILHAS